MKTRAVPAALSSTITTATFVWISGSSKTKGLRMPESLRKCKNDVIEKRKSKEILQGIFEVYFILCGMGHLYIYDTYARE